MLSRIQIQITQVSDHHIPLKWAEKIGKTVLQEELCENEGILSIVLVNDSEIQKLNTQFLGRNYPTDVIAFPLEKNHDEIWGEIYISMDRAKEQANDFHVSLIEEFTRLVIHGILHLLGYDDQINIDKTRMRKKEDHYLKIFQDDFSSL